jgi:hypothetical protein
MATLLMSTDNVKLMYIMHENTHSVVCIFFFNSQLGTLYDMCETCENLLIF